MKYLLSVTAAALVAVAVINSNLDAAPQYVAPYQDASLIASWYQRYLGRNPDDFGLQGWVQELHRGRNVEAAILGSDEYYSRHGSSPEGFVAGLYVDVLRRQPSWQEVQGWMQRWQQVGYNREALAADFLSAASAELGTRGAPQQSVAPWAIPSPQYYRAYSPVHGWFHNR